MPPSGLVYGRRTSWFADSATQWHYDGFTPKNLYVPIKDVIKALQTVFSLLVYFSHDNSAPLLLAKGGRVCRSRRVLACLWR